MSSQTTNWELTKPVAGEYDTAEIASANLDILDGILTPAQRNSLVAVIKQDGTLKVQDAEHADESSSCTGNAATASACTGNSATATYATSAGKINPAHKINNITFDGSADIELHAVDISDCPRVYYGTEDVAQHTFPSGVTLRNGDLYIQYQG